MFIDLIGIQPIEVLRSFQNPFACLRVSFPDVVMPSIDLIEP